jgi:16S rRNA (cytidine1402-2'-O)-methyltransferase
MPLTLVPTPLGNLGDITLRALEALRAADLIVAEDTRVTRKLLNALEVGTKDLWSYREQNAPSVTGAILERARTQNVVLVSDAGMPCISDPGAALVAAARTEGVAVEALPGPSALLGAAALCGFSLRRFTFEGFVPRTSRQRQEAFEQSIQSGMASIWYESPQRIAAALDDLARVAPDSTVFLLREYTKRFEQQLCGSPEAVRSALETPVRGEIAFVISPPDRAVAAADPADAQAAIDVLLERGMAVAQIAKTLSDAGLGERRALYALAGHRKRERGMVGASVAEGQGFE